MDTIKQIARTIKERRIELGLKQKDVATQINMNVSTYSNIEQGVATINITTCSRIYHVLEVLGLDYDKFMNDHGVVGSFVQAAKGFEVRTRIRACKKKVDSPIKKVEKEDNKKVHLITRDTDKRRYFSGSHIESIGNTVHKHRLYTFTTNRDKAVEFKSFEKAGRVAKKLKNVHIITEGK